MSTGVSRLIGEGLAAAALLVLSGIAVQSEVAKVGVVDRRLVSQEFRVKPFAAALLRSPSSWRSACSTPTERGCHGTSTG